MNFRMIGQVIGRVLCIEAALMLLPMVAALAYGRDAGAVSDHDRRHRAASGWSCGACAQNPAA